MSRVEFDELLRQKIDSEELEVDPVHWDRLSALLPAAPPAKSRRLMPWLTGIAASVAILVAAAWLFIGKSNNQPAQPALSEKEQPVNNTPPAITDTAALSPAGKGAKPLNNIFTPASPKAIQAHNNNIAHVEEKIQDNPADMPGTEQANGYKPSDPVKAEAIVKDNNQPLFNDDENIADKETYTYKMPDLVAGRRAEGNNDLSNGTSVGLGGGVNYGTMNTGYTLGLSARRYVSDKVFLDGTVAVLMNKNAESTLNYTGDFIADQEALTNNKRARPSSESYYYPAQGLYYIQFNPSIGYKVAKRVAMSVGGDFQQMLQNSANNQTLLFSDGEDARLFPTFDVGVTGKTEINVTPSIQAGVLYREGINNLIRNESRYVNRRYVQVQVKYSLPIR